MDIDYVVQKDEPPQVTDTSTSAAIALYECWERSNRLSLMFIKSKINAGDRGPIKHHNKVLGSGSQTRSGKIKLFDPKNPHQDPSSSD